uniref:Uncharacterized protein n=1 Tax=Arundo donax TaxID=35708 RepID=A0A0A9DPF8_ARUDO
MRRQYPMKICQPWLVYVQSPGKPVGQSKEQRSAHEKLQSATRSPSTISPACFPISAYAWQDRVIVSSHT